MEGEGSRPQLITGNLYQLGTRNFPTYLSLGREAMIIEGGTGPTADIIASQIAFLNIDPGRIKYVLLTHTHVDHIGSVSYLKRLWPHLEVVGSPAAYKMISRGGFAGELLSANRVIAGFLRKNGDLYRDPLFLDDYRFEVDRVVEEGEEIDLGDGVRWRIAMAPGHSPCHLCALEQKEATLSIGDLAGYFDPDLDVIWPNYFHSLKHYQGSIARAWTMEPERLLLSHNGVVAGGTKAYLEKAFRATEHYHHEMLERSARGETEGDIAREKADWVYAFAPITTYETIRFLCRLLVKKSLEACGSGYETPHVSKGEPINKAVNERWNRRA